MENRPRKPAKTSGYLEFLADMPYQAGKAAALKMAVKAINVPERDQVVIVGPDRVKIVETPEYGEITVVLHDGKATFVDSKKREKL